MYSKILVALDQSDAGRKVFDEALFLSKSANAPLMLVNVLSPFDGGYPDMPIFPTIDGVYPIHHTQALDHQVRYWDEIKDASTRFLQSLAQEAIAAGVVTDYTQGYGDPGATICTLADKWGANLVIVGRRGLTGLSELLMGSVSNYVLHHAPCSVLTVQNHSTHATTTKTTAAVTTA